MTHGLAGLSTAQRFRIAKARSRRLLAKTEAHTDWMNECVPALMDMGKDQVVAVAACLNMWRQAWEETHPDGADDPGPSPKQLDVSLQALLKDFDEGKHPRDEHGRWTDGGGDSDGAARPVATKGAGASDAAFAKIEAAVAAIPASHAAKIAHVPVVLTHTSDDFPGHIAAGGGASTVGLFGWANDQPRIDVAEAVKVEATITEVGATPQSYQTVSLLPVRQPEQVTVHEMAHALDYDSGWTISDDASLKQNFAAATAQMTERETKNARYWIGGGQREMFAELYSSIYNPNRGNDQTYFGGMTRPRVREVFALAIADIMKIKQAQIERAVPAPPTSTAGAWFVNEDGKLFALLGGMPYEVDVSGTPLAVRLTPGTYADDAALMAAISAEKSLQWRLAREQAERFLKAWNEADHPRVPAGSGDDSGQFAPSGGGTSSDKPKKKGKAKREDFAKADIALSMLDSDVDKFIDKWNEKVGEDPAEFKKDFMGGLDGTMKISGSGTYIQINGSITKPDEGRTLGTFTRELDLDKKTAASSYFSLNKAATGSDVGKKMLAGNVATYEELGIEKVSVFANIDVGGYAWAKYGYVPTTSAWSELRASLERRLSGSSSSVPRGDNVMEAESWDMLGSDRQDDVRDRWMQMTQIEFLHSEQQNWRDSGQAKNDAQSELAYKYENESFVPDWVSESFDKSRADRKEAGLPDIPYTNQQLFAAVDLTFESYHGDGSDKPKIEFDDDQLRKPQGIDPNQPTLPGIEAPDYSKYLTEAMRDEITTDLMNAFDDKAEENADEMDPPSYLAEQVGEYQEEYWDSMDDEQKLSHALEFGMADIEIEPEEDEEPEMELPAPTAPEVDPLLAAVRSSDPKSIWKIADNPRGKELLLGKSWNGVLNLKDKDSMARFNKYVGRAAA